MWKPLLAVLPNVLACMEETGEQVSDLQDLSNAMNRHKAGDTVTVTAYRGKRKLDVKVVLGEMREQA